MNSERETWVDDVKALACVLVTLGHFYKSMAEANIISSSSIYDCFITILYYFHVPLFFICSGYLFQKYSNVRTFNAWKTNLVKKLLVLGVPYFIFSLMTWGLKTVFASSVNRKIGGLTEILFITPTAPYWYLYTLFFVFAVVITIRTKKEAFILLGIAVLLKFLRCMHFNMGIYAIDKTVDYLIWFVFGMLMAYGMIKICNIQIAVILFTIFILGSLINYYGIISILEASTIFGIIACYSIICIIRNIDYKIENNKIISILRENTMPIFLMHTLIAAPCRIVLLKLGINYLWIHLCIGLVASFIGPIIAMNIMNRLKPLDFLVFPSRYIKIKKYN